MNKNINKNMEKNISRTISKNITRNITQNITNNTKMIRREIVVNKHPEISVVMAMYNVSKYLDETLKTVINQTFSDFELLLVDDGSTDSSLKIARIYARKDRRIKIIANKKNRGVTACRNLAIKDAKGKYIAILDSDDVAMPERLRIQHDYLEKHPEIFLVGGSYEYIDDHGKHIYTEIYDFDWKKTKKLLVYRNIIHNPTVMFRNDRETLYREKVKYSEDRDLWMRLLTRGKKLVVLPDVAIKYRMHPNSLSVNKSLKLQLFSEKAVEWYFERKKYGKDSYDSFDPDSIMRLPDKNIFNEDYIKKQNIQLLHKTDKKRFRKEILAYMRHEGLRKWKRAPLLWLNSYIPVDIIGKYNQLSKWIKYYILK